MNPLLLWKHLIIHFMKKNPSDNNGTITLKVKNNFPNMIYLQIIAHIQQGNNLEYISYKGIKYSKTDPEPEEEKEEEKEENEEEKEERKEEKEEEREEKKEEEKDDKNDDKRRNEENNNNTNSNTSFIIIISIAGAIIIFILAFILIHFCRKKCIRNDIDIEMDKINFSSIEEKQLI